MSSQVAVYFVARLPDWLAAGSQGTLDATAVAVALAWVASRPGISSTLIGPRTIEQLDENLTEIHLPTELAKRLDTLSAPANGPVNGMFTNAT